MRPKLTSLMAENTCAISLSEAWAISVICSVPMPAIWVICSMASGSPISSGPMASWKPKTMARVSITQMKNWVRATLATPRILPIIRSKGLTEETMTSTILLDFSLMTLVMTMLPNIVTNM